ncbi:hypothetical protein ES702_06464 [subsurface metagenome]
MHSHLLASKPLASPSMGLGASKPRPSASLLQEGSPVRPTHASVPHSVDADNVNGPAGDPTASQPGWVSVNHSHHPTAPPCKRNGIGRQPLDEPQCLCDDLVGDEDQMCIDSTRSDHSVYMKNGKSGSWSGTLPSEDDVNENAKLPLQAELAIKRIIKAQQLEEQQLQEILKIAACATLDCQGSRSVADEIGTGWPQDCIMRNVLRVCTWIQSRGAILTIDRRSSSELALRCASPNCTASDRMIPDGAYYITLTHSDMLAVHYCLTCLDHLWNGEGMTGELPARRYEEERPLPRMPRVASFSLDGADGRSLSPIAHLNLDPFERDSRVFRCFARNVQWSAVCCMLEHHEI